LGATPRIFMREMRAYQVSREREVIRIWKSKYGLTSLPTKTTTQLGNNNKKRI
jgi:hypothetical protein